MSSKSRKGTVERQPTPSPKKQSPEKLPTPSRHPTVEKQPVPSRKLTAEKQTSLPAPHGGPSKEEILRDILNAQLHGNDERCLEFVNMEQHTAYAVISELERSNEARSHRYTYNAVLHTFAVVIMPTTLHECHLAWLSDEKMEMRAAGYLPAQHARQLRFLASPDRFPFVTPHANSKKEPDLTLIPEGSRMPTIVVESGWSESRKKLHDDMRIWINGGRPFIQMVFVIKWTRGRGSNNNLVRGDIEIFRLGTAGPISVQKEIIFPAPPPPLDAQQAITVTKRDLWGQFLPSGQNPTMPWDMKIDELRTIARETIVNMGLTPA